MDPKNDLNCALTKLKSFFTEKYKVPITNDIEFN